MTSTARPAATAKDVAREAGVHQSTVSRALDPAQADRVRPETRLRVEQAARKLNYNPNLTARDLRSQRTMTVGVLIPSFGNPVYGSLVRGISAELEQRRYHALVIETPDGRDRIPSALAILQGRRVDGMIIASARTGDEDAVRRVMDAGVPVVLALRWLDALDTIRVINDDELGGALAARHLIELGHRRLAEVGGPESISNFTARSRGFRKVAERAGIEVVGGTFQAQAPTIAEGRRTTARLLDLHAGVTGVFAHNDLLAVGALESLAARRLRCPDDVSIVGYNDSPLTAHLAPPLTTVRMPIDPMGHLAARRLLEVIDGASADPVTLSLPPRLLVRQSTARAPRRWH